MSSTHETQHPFTHMGPGPYKYRGMFEMPSQSLQEANPSAYNDALREVAGHKLEEGYGCCSCCSAAIRNVCIIECGDGTRWGVGTTCVEKVSCEPAIVSQVKRALRSRRKQQRQARERTQIAAAMQWFAEHEDELRAIPETWSFGSSSGKWTYFHRVMRFLEQLEWRAKSPAERFSKTMEAWKEAKKRLA